MLHVSRLAEPPAIDPFAISEIDHRIANNLALIASLVRLRAQGAAAAGPLPGVEAAQLLREAAVQIEAVAQLHRMLSQRPAASALPVAPFLADVCGAMSDSLSGRLRLEQSWSADTLMPRERALPLALIVAELLTNAAKYSHPAGVAGIVRLGCALTAEGRFVLEVEDDGVGFPEGFDVTRDGGLGLRVIRALARQLGAEWRFQSTPLGLRFRLEASVSG